MKEDHVSYLFKIRNNQTMGGSRQ